jgi:hypothetical protein
MTTERAGVEVGGDSKEAVRELEQLKDKAVQVSGSLRGMGQSLAGMATQAAMTGLAVVGLDSVMAVAQRTIETVSQSIRAYAEQSGEAAARMEDVSDATNAFKVSLGGVILESEGVQRSMFAVGELLRQLAEIFAPAGQNAAAFGTIIGAAAKGAAESMVAFANATISALRAVVRTGEEILGGGVDEDAQRMMNAAADADRQIRSFLEGEYDTRGFRRALRDAVDVGVLSSEEAERVILDIESGSTARNQRARNVLRATEAEFSALNQRLGQSMGAANEQFSAQEAALDELQSTLDAFSVDSFSAEFQSIGAMEVPSPASIASAIRADNEAIQEALDERNAIKEADQLRQEDLARKAEAMEERSAQKLIDLARVRAETEAALEAEALAAKAKREAIARESAGLTASLVGELAAGEEQALDVIKRFLGQELMAKGQALAIEGGATLAFSPVGALKLAAGLGMVAAGARLARTGGGGSGTAVESGAAPIPAATTPAPSTTMTQQVSFGIVGDPRAAAALVADSTRTAMREGFRGAA